MKSIKPSVSIRKKDGKIKFGFRFNGVADLNMSKKRYSNFELADEKLSKIDSSNWDDAKKDFKKSFKKTEEFYELDGYVRDRISELTKICQEYISQHNVPPANAKSLKRFMGGSSSSISLSEMLQKVVDAHTQSNDLKKVSEDRLKFYALVIAIVKEYEKEYEGKLLVDVGLPDDFSIKFNEFMTIVVLINNNLSASISTYQKYREAFLSLMEKAHKMKLVNLPKQQYFLINKYPEVRKGDENIFLSQKELKEFISLKFSSSRKQVNHAFAVLMLLSGLRYVDALELLRTNEMSTENGKNEYYTLVQHKTNDYVYIVGELVSKVKKFIVSQDSEFSLSNQTTNNNIKDFAKQVLKGKRVYYTHNNILGEINAGVAERNGWNVKYGVKFDYQQAKSQELVEAKFSCQSLRKSFTTWMRRCNMTAPEWSMLIGHANRNLSNSDVAYGQLDRDVVEMFIDDVYKKLGEQENYSDIKALINEKYT